MSKYSFHCFKICFVRVSRPATPVIYNNQEQFSVGKAKIVRRSDSDQVLVVAAGITLAETMKAADMLAAKVIVHIFCFDHDCKCSVPRESTSV